MSFTVVPLHNLELERGTRIPFGSGFVLQDLPDWLKEPHILDDLDRNDRQLTLDAKHALVAEYPASALGHPDPDWKGVNAKSIQDLKFQSAMLANLALWLRQPSPARFTIGIHALSWAAPGHEDAPPVIMQFPSHLPLCCHPRDFNNPVWASHLIKAGALHSVLSTIPRKNAVWAALRAFWAAVTTYVPDYRYPLFWQGLESLFGADDNVRGLTRRLCERISFFLSDSEQTQQILFEQVKLCYNTRSQIVHGRWEEGPELEAVMYDTESIVRTVVRHLLEKPGMLEAFLSPNRDAFLETWVNSKSFVPPPLP